MEKTEEQAPVMPPPLKKESLIDLSPFDKYYQEEFRKIHESNEQYKGSWNWYSFFFSSFWCLYKGCWAYGVIIIGSMVLSYGSSFYLPLGLGWMIILGKRGTWLLYNVKIKLKQFPKSLA